MFDAPEVDDLLGSGVDELDETGVLDALLGLEGAISRMQVVRAQLMARAEREELAVADCGLRTSLWLARLAKRPSQATRPEVAVARTAVEWFAVMLEAAAKPLGADGVRGVGWDHVELLVSVSNTRNRERLASVQAELIAAARELSFRDWARLVRTVAAEADEDGGHDPNAELHSNRLRIEVNPDGSRGLKAQLTADAGVVVDSVIEEIADELFAQWTRDKQADPGLLIPDRKTLMALALAEACRRARATDLESSSPARAEAVVIIDRDAHSENPVAFDQRGKQIPATALEALLNDAEFRALVTDAARIPLSMGRKKRLVTREQRMALTVRDGGCVFPGCEAPATWCDAHHVVPWQVGGETVLVNLALLCRHHHGLTHRNGWQMKLASEPDEPTRFTWTTPSGHTIHSQHRPPGRSTREHQPAA
jgi:hypothetical protein